jgi:voltage-gated potassium channel
MNFQFIHKRLLRQRRFREMLILSVIVALVVGILIVPIERRSDGSTIKTISDGMWWSVQTLTTVGYGDTTPITDEGRIIGVLMQVVGAALFGTIVAMISSSMSRRQEEFYWNRLFERLDRTESKLQEIERRTGFLVHEDTNQNED